MEKLYNRQVFHNNSTPAINETNLNILTKAVDDIDNRVIQMDVVQDMESIHASVVEAQESADQARQYRDEAETFTPTGYSAVVAQVNTNKTDITSLKSALTNFNLLDNSWFLCNSRGQTTYSGDGYTVDRWTKGNGAQGNVVVNDGYITFSINANSTWANLTQYVDTKNTLKMGETYTLSCKYRITKGSAKYFVFRQDGNSIFLNSLVADGQWHIASASGIAGNSKYIIANIINDDFWTSGTVGTVPEDCSIDIACVKLEYGSTSTLANDHAPNYADELVRCQMSKADTTDTYANGSSASGDGWVSNATYTVGSHVIYDNALYKCKVQNSNQVPKGNTTYWTKTSCGNELSKIQGGIATDTTTQGAITVVFPQPYSEPPIVTASLIMPNTDYCGFVNIVSVSNTGFVAYRRWVKKSDNAQNSANQSIYWIAMPSS